VLQLEGELALNIAQQIGHFAQEQKDALASPHPVPPMAHGRLLARPILLEQEDGSRSAQGDRILPEGNRSGPNYALAYAGLRSYIMLANWGFAPPRDLPEGQAQLERRWNWTEQLAEAHTSLAYVTLLYEWDWAAAEKRFPQGIALNPNYLPPTTFTAFYW